jgi:hypothetical protein
MFPYDQHRRSLFMQGMACCAFPDENRTTVTATQRLNMSTSAVELQKGQYMLGSILQNLHIVHIVHIMHIMHIMTNARIEI